MHYALNPRFFIFSHYFYTGLRVATGVIGLTAAVFWLADLRIAMAVCIGALCASLMDLPSPLRHKFNELLACTLVCSAVTLLISLCSPFGPLLNVMLVAVSFVASMMVVYGKKTLPLQFAALFVMTLTMVQVQTPRQALLHTGLFLAGGLAYTAYAMAVSWLLRHRTRQQVLAEALFDLSQYVAIKADCYDLGVDLNGQFTQLVRQQVVLADRQQAARDLLLRGRQGERERRLVQIHFCMLDLYELVLSTHPDYALLRRHQANAPVLALLRGLVAKCARDIETIAYAVTRRQSAPVDLDYQAELQAVDREMQQLEQDSRDGKLPAEALIALRAACNKLREVIDMIGQLHRATQAEPGPLPALPKADMTPFLTQQKYELGLMLSSLRWSSPVFRFSLRVALAVAVGLFVANHLPYVAHGYWIVLTIAVVLKPSYSMTKQRRGDRLVGTVIGCTAAAVLLYLVHSPAVLLAALFVATAAAPTFVTVKYRYTAIAVSMQILIQTNLLLPAGHHVISERLIDTAIGALIATVFSFVLPSWEYRALPRLIQGVLQANQRYIEASRDLLQGKTQGDFVYRLCRKRFMDALAGLSAALTRMLDEPADKQHAVDDLNHFIMQNYLVVAHMAAMRLLLRRHADEMEPEQLNAQLQQACDQVWAMLEQAQQGLSSQRSPVRTYATAADVTAPATWSGDLLLQRRIGLLHADAQEIALRSAAIGQALGRAAQ